MLRGARVFEGTGFSEPKDVAFDDGVLVSGVPQDAEVIDAAGGYLIPGLIDCHIHLYGPHNQERLAAAGVTTALDMSSPAPLVNALRGRPGVTDLRSAMMATTSPTSAHAERLKNVPAAQEALVASAADAEAAVALRVQQGADYIKIVVDLPGFDEETVTALVRAAHEHGLQTVAHASRSDAVDLAEAAGVDVFTHVPLDRAVEAAQAARLASAGKVVAPTLVMMKGIVERLAAAGIPGPSYDAARDSVRALHAAGVPILAGTDANETPAVPASPLFGTSLHDELELLVDAGLTPVEALRAATSLPAEHFGLTDRGAISPGLRADLVLLDADPTLDISATRAIRQVWITGRAVSPSPEPSSR
ncbi:hypothetical protein B7R54_06185 [Subtercola boreus]|uniref:Amidohydrolase-related domain-containing protein n=1 Tax=Subtercola boreus TaxID=120213 RepID=A0A3E0VNZ5_9MICO|nr:hypothetical protein B7R54_06185 [Subtercola boreus]